MGIRDTSYFGFSNKAEIGPTLIDGTSSYAEGSITSVATNGVGNVYVGATVEGGAWDVISSVIASLFESRDNGHTFTDVSNKITIGSAVPSIVGVAASSSNVYLWATYTGIYKSTDYGKTFTHIDETTPQGGLIAGPQTTSGFYLNRRNGRIYATTQDTYYGTATILTSADGVVWGYLANGTVGLAPSDIVCADSGSSTNKVFVSFGCYGMINDSATSATSVSIMSGTATLGGFTTVAAATYTHANGLKVGPMAVDTNNTKIYQIGSIKRADTSKWAVLIRSSSHGVSAWGSQSFGESNTDYYGIDVAVDRNNNTYVAGISGSNSFLLASYDAGLTWKPVASIVGKKTTTFHIDEYDNMYWGLADNQSGKELTLLRGSLTANSASLGTRMFATSVGYVDSELSGAINEKFKLNNISEFPHYGGLFQIPSLVLGTKEIGKIGKDIQNSIITVNHIGSVVRIMWPKQSDGTQVKGFGDLSVGQQAGNLTSEFQPGEFFDVTDFDHMTLWCYVRKNSSGSLDDIEVKVERKPMKDVGFVADQAVETSVSGSYVVSRYREHLHAHQVNYGDTIIAEEGWPIDLDLVNTKELRISCRQKYGQSADDNKNFVVWGRFIKRDKNVVET
jgi:hypothetical protein